MQNLIMSLKIYCLRKLSWREIRK